MRKLESVVQHWSLDYRLSHFDGIPECDGRTDRLKAYDSTTIGVAALPMCSKNQDGNWLAQVCLESFRYDGMCVCVCVWFMAVAGLPLQSTKYLSLSIKMTGLNVSDAYSLPDCWKHRLRYVTIIWTDLLNRYSSLFHTFTCLIYAARMWAGT